MALSPAGSDWTAEANDLLVADYFAMLADELAGQPYVKRRHNEALVQKTGRSRGSVEFKYQNVSAVLSEMGCPTIVGYKPAMNAQFDALTAAIDRYLADSPTVLDLDVRAPILLPNLDPFVSAPARKDPKDKTSDAIHRLVRKFDPVERDAKNRALGKKGEAFVMEVEERSLFAAGRRDLVRELRWVSDLDGDGAGYDIRSFDPKTGAKKLIEVKTTCGGARVPFFMSRNERSFAAECREEFNLYRVFDFAAAPKIFKLRPPLEGAVNFEAEAWRATFE